MDNNFATKYRPTTFSEVVGQDIPKAVLSRIAMSPTVTARCIFLRGAYGCGKTTLCRIFAKAVNCPSFATTHDPCCTCPSCLEVTSPNSQLYLEYDATICQDLSTIEKLTARLQVPPPSPYRRVVVFDEVHAAGPKVLNALLKLVEEGIPSTIFVFASTEAILPTLESRSLCLDITTVPPALMTSRLNQVATQENLSLTPSATAAICMKSNGHMRNALSLLQLYSLAGETALSSSSSLIPTFFSHALKHDPSASDILTSILLHPVTDIRTSLYSFISSVYQTPNHPLLTSGIINKLFSFFFSPTAQTALSSEIGTELLLRSFLSKCK